MFLGIWNPARPPEVCILKELQNGNRVSALPLQPTSFVWQENIYKNILKYIWYFPLTPVLPFTFLKLNPPNTDEPKQKMTIEAAVNWPTFMSQGRDNRAKSREKKKSIICFWFTKPKAFRGKAVSHINRHKSRTLGSDKSKASLPHRPAKGPK